jgi:hypothetical protein
VPTTVAKDQNRSFTMSLIRRPGFGVTPQIVLRLSCSSPKTPPEPEHQGDERQTYRRGSRPCGPRAANGRLDCLRSLLPDQVMDLADNPALRRRAEEKTGQRHDNHEAGSEGEDRVVGERRAHTLRPVLIPVADGRIQQRPDIAHVTRPVSRGRCPQQE